MAIDTSKPFTRENWNEDIIQEVNILCTNPDEGCDPLPLIDKVNPKHIWTKQDVKEVQDKLIKICPENKFDKMETPQLWTYGKEVAIIKPIEEAIERGWCGCEPKIIDLGTYYAVEVPAGRREEQSDGKIQSVTACGTIYTQYHSPWYPEVDNDNVAVWTAYNIIIAKKAEYQSLAYEIFDLEDDIEKLEAEITILKDEIKKLESDLYFAEIYLEELKTERDAICGNDPQNSACQDAQEAVTAQETVVQDIKDDIKEKENELEEKENELEEKETEKEEKETERDAARAAFDQAAQDEWAALQTYDVRYPPDLQPIRDIIPVMDEPWGNYFEDTRGTSKGKWYYYVTDILGDKKKTFSGDFSPNGYPYVYPKSTTIDYLTYIDQSCKFTEITVWHDCNCFAWQLNPLDCCFEQPGDYECGHEDKTIYWTYISGAPMAIYPHCTMPNGTRMAPIDWHLELKIKHSPEYTRPPA